MTNNKIDYINFFLSGTISGTLNSVMFQPLDLVKTRMQQSDLSTTTSSFTKNKLSKTLNQILKSDGICGLWRGTNITIIRNGLGIGLYFVTLEKMKTIFRQNDQTNKATLLGPFSSGLLARFIAGTLTTPLSILKVRYEHSSYKDYKFKQHYNALKSSGFHGMFSGVVATSLRDAPYAGLYYMSYVNVKELFGDSAFMAGLFAGVFATLVTHPFDVAKTRIQESNKKTTITRVFDSLYKEKHFFKSFYAGFSMRVTRKGLSSAFTWTFYEKIIDYLSIWNKSQAKYSTILG